MGIVLQLLLYVVANACCWYGLQPPAALAASSVILFFEIKISNLGGGLAEAAGMFAPSKRDWFWDLFAVVANVVLAVLGAIAGLALK